MLVKRVKQALLQDACLVWASPVTKLLAASMAAAAPLTRTSSPLCLDFFLFLLGRKAALLSAINFRFESQSQGQGLYEHVGTSPLNFLRAFIVAWDWLNQAQ